MSARLTSKHDGAFKSPKVDLSGAAKLIEAIRARGSDARDLRDAAHEAHHALSAKVRGPWDRENIHKFVIRLRRSDEILDEMVARAVETIVCERFGVAIVRADGTPWTLEQRAMTSSMEAMKYGRPYLPTLELTVKAMRNALASSTAQEHAERVIALAGDRA